MTIALISATGRVGSRLATERLSHGHAVTGIALHVPPDVRPGLTVLEPMQRDPIPLRLVLWVTTP